MLDHVSILNSLLAPNPDERIVIRPILSLRDQLQPSSIDVRLGPHFKVFRLADYSHLDPMKADEIRRDIVKYAEEVDRDYLHQFVLHPGDFVLGSTFEYIRIPPIFTARLEGRSSWARLGLLVHSTGGFIDPGFGGNITFELLNVGKIPFYLYVGLRIAQLSFHRLERKAIMTYDKKASSKYQGDVEPTFSKVFEDVEFEIFRKMESARKEKSTKTSSMVAPPEIEEERVEF